MNREETLKAIEVMKAYCDGRIVEVSRRGHDEYLPLQNPLWEWDTFHYRIKPEPKLRPFTQEEFLKEWKENPVLRKKTSFGSPVYVRICTVQIDGVYVGETKMTYEEMAEKWEFHPSGKPCGVEE